MTYKVLRDCKHCGQKVHNRYAYYCSNRCQIDFQYEEFISHWLSGDINGSIGINVMTTSAHIRRYLDLNSNSICVLCGWSQVNPITNKVPLEIDHIYGNSENNSPQNLRLICPNCHTLTSNFRGLNKGNDRQWRKLKYKKNNPS